MKPLTEERKKFLRDYFVQKSLSKSEVEVVILALQGLINREVANRLCMDEKTIKFHLGNAYKKLNISRRSQLIWTLPLADFVGISSHKVQFSQIKPVNPRRGAMKPLTEERKKFLRDYFVQKSLSKSEVEVVILALQGLINMEIADRLCMDEKTIKFHLGNAYKKLNISRRSQLIWTLPLADFVGISSHKVQFSQI